MYPPFVNPPIAVPTGESPLLSAFPRGSPRGARRPVVYISCQVESREQRRKREVDRKGKEGEGSKKEERKRKQEGGDVGR